ncbi:MAG: hypothetical protein JO353_12640, partial [Phycisphaerae bacterium]|nr:hypothetical protein [Phycisphaerae bacterium]
MPIKFAIYRDGVLQTSFTPVAAVVAGPESVPIAGDVVFQDGLLQCVRTEEIPVGVSLLWEAGAIGTFLLETARLPPCEKPYNLNVELARGRLMKIIQKQEDWNLFDFPRAEKLVMRCREAQIIFADALGKLDDGPAASKIADRVLELALEVSEDLAMFHAELLLNRRRQSNQLARHIFGCRVDSTIQNQKYKDTLSGQFDYAILPMGWKQIQPEEGAFATQPVDDWIEQLSKKRIPVVAGPLIDLGDNGAPDWVFLWEHDFDTIRDLAYEYVHKVVHRYRRGVAVWNVVAGLHTASGFSLSFDQTIELTRLLVAEVKTLLPGARTIITIRQPWGEYHSKGGGVPPMLYAE